MYSYYKIIEVGSGYEVVGKAYQLQRYLKGDNLLRFEIQWCANHNKVLKTKVGKFRVYKITREEYIKHYNRLDFEYNK